MPSKSDTIRKLFADYHAKDRAAVAAVFTDDFRFTSPYDDNIDKAEYFVCCWPNSERIIKAHEIERIFEQGDGAFVTYLCTTKAGMEFRNTEYMTFAGDRIRRVDVYFGASYKDGKFVKASGA